MQHTDWENIRHFLEVVRAGSVRQAALHLGVNQTTVSRRVTHLETQLGKKLFERSGKAWVITPMGERLVESAEHMAEEAHTISRFVMAESQELRGRLRLTVGDVCTQQLAMPAIKRFMQTYPQVDLEIIATREDLDLASREADIALRATYNPPPNLVGKRIAPLAFAVYGNQSMRDYVQSHRDPKEIPCITWVGDSHTRPPWIEKNFPRTHRIYRTSELGIMHQMACQGLGVAQLPCALCDPDPNLFRIPAVFVEPGWGLWVLSHVDLRTTARVRMFKNFLVEDLVRNKDLIAGGVA